MSAINQGRNDLRFNNSKGQCLLENWVEERAVEPLDTKEGNTDKSTSAAQVFKDGHTGLLSTDVNSGVEKVTTVMDDYRPPRGPGVRMRGKKAELLEQMLYEQVSIS